MKQSIFLNIKVLCYTKFTVKPIALIQFPMINTSIRLYVYNWSINIDFCYNSLFVNLVTSQDIIYFWPAVLHYNTSVKLDNK
jgi:hypothetical protein